MLPPSRGASGDRYVWDDTRPLGAAPDSIVGAITSAKVKSPRALGVGNAAATGGGLERLRELCALVRHAPTGRRNTTLNSAAFECFRRAAAGELDVGRIEPAFVEASRSNGFDGSFTLRDVERTLESARAGLLVPWRPRSERQVRDGDLVALRAELADAMDEVVQTMRGVDRRLAIAAILLAHDLRKASFDLSNRDWALRANVSLPSVGAGAGRLEQTGWIGRERADIATHASRLTLRAIGLDGPPPHAKSYAPLWRMCDQKMRLGFHAAFRGEGLPPDAGVLLGVISSAERDVSVGEIGQICGWSESQANRLLRPLVEQGLVVRRSGGLRARPHKTLTRLLGAIARTNGGRDRLATIRRTFRQESKTWRTASRHLARTGRMPTQRSSTGSMVFTLREPVQHRGDRGDREGQSNQGGVAA